MKFAFMLGVVLVAVCGHAWMADAAGGVARAGGGDDGGDDGPSRPCPGSHGNSFSGTVDEIVSLFYVN